MTPAQTWRRQAASGTNSEVLDPAWAALVVGGEIPVVGALVRVLLDDARLADKRSEATDARSAAQAQLVAPAVIALHRAVEAERRPKQITRDGIVPAESFEDTLARGRYEVQFQAIVDAVNIRSAPLQRVRRCRRRGLILALTLVLLAVAFPLALWEQLWSTRGGPASEPTVFYAVLGGAFVLASICGLFYVLGRSSLSTSIADAKGSDR